MSAPFTSGTGLPSEVYFFCWKNLVLPSCPVWIAVPTLTVSHGVRGSVLEMPAYTVPNTVVSRREMVWTAMSRFSRVLFVEKIALYTNAFGTSAASATASVHLPCQARTDARPPSAALATLVLASAVASV